MPSQIAVAPTDEPLSLTEAKAHLRIIAGDTSNDLWLQGAIASVRDYGQTICRRAFCSQTWKLVLDKFPSPSLEVSASNWYGPAWGIGPGPLTALPATGRTGFEMFLPVSPVQSITSIKYIDATLGTQQTLASNQYAVDLVSEPGRITPAYATSWPATQNIINAVEVQFVAGYGDATTVPEGIKSWMKLRLGALFENREEFIVGTRIVVADMPFVDRLLDPYRVITY